jgi:hypothetical protein
MMTVREQYCILSGQLFMAVWTTMYGSNLTNLVVVYHIVFDHNGSNHVVFST